MRFSTKIALLLGLWAVTAPIWSQSGGASLSAPVQWGTEADRGRTEVNPKDRTVLLTNKAWVQYSGLDLRAGEIFIDFNNSLLTAYGVRDSSGKMEQYPVFKEGERNRLTALAQAAAHLKLREIVDTGDVSAISCGDPMGAPGGTNMLCICEVR